MVLFLFNNVIYVFLLLCLCILIVYLCMATLTMVFPCFFLSRKANARVKPAKTEHGPHSSKFLRCSIYCLFCAVLCIVCVYICTVLLPPGGYTIAVKYIISHRIIYHIIISYHISYHIVSTISYRIISYHISYRMSVENSTGIFCSFH